MQTAFSPRLNSNQRQLLNYVHWQSDLTSVDARRKLCQVLSLLFPSSWQWADPTKEPAPSPLGPSHGEAQEWWQFGKWFVPHTHKSCLQQWGNGRAGPDTNFWSSHCYVLQGVSLLLSLCLRPSEWSSSSLSLFISPSSAFMMMNKMHRSHFVTTEQNVNHISGVHVLPRASSDAAWSTADVVTGLSKSQPFAGGSTAHSLLHLTSKSNGEYAQRWKMPLPHHCNHITCLVFTRFYRYTFPWPKVLAVSF